MVEHVAPHGKLSEFSKHLRTSWIKKVGVEGLGCLSPLAASSWMTSPARRSPSPVLYRIAQRKTSACSPACIRLSRIGCTCRAGGNSAELDRPFEPLQNCAGTDRANP